MARAHRPGPRPLPAASSSSRRDRPWRRSSTRSSDAGRLPARAAEVRAHGRRVFLLLGAVSWWRGHLIAPRVMWGAGVPLARRCTAPSSGLAARRASPTSAGTTSGTPVPRISRWPTSTCTPSARCSGTAIPRAPAGTRTCRGRTPRRRWPG